MTTYNLSFVIAMKHPDSYSFLGEYLADAFKKIPRDAKNIKIETSRCLVSEDGIHLGIGSDLTVTFTWDEELGLT